MKTLQRSFEALLAKYQERVADFKEVIESWQVHGRLKEHKVGMELLAAAEHYIKQMESNPDKKTFASFKKVFKQLHEITKPVWRQWVEAVVVALTLAIVFRNFIFGLYHVPTGSAEKTILVGDRIWGNKMAYLFGDKPQRGDSVIFDNPEFLYGQTSGLGYWWQRYVGFPIPLLGLQAGPDNWVKRVIAIPGDTIEGRIEDGKTVIYRNGEKLVEPYVNTYPLIRVKKSVGFYDGENFGPFPVPSFLRYMQKMVRYSFDPSKPLDKQPFYNLTEDEVIRNWETQEFVLDHPFTPSYDYDQRCADVFGPFILPEGKYWVMGDSRKNSRDSRYWTFLDEKLIHGRASFIIYSVDSEEATWIFDLLKHPIDFWTKHVRWSRSFGKL